MTHYQRHAEATSDCHAPAEAVFAHLDSQEKLGAHMAKPSWMMLGGSMRYKLDADGGRKVGSVIRMEGSVAGVRLSFDEVILERDPPHRKVWETQGTPNLIVIGAYRMGFELSQRTSYLTTVRVFINYNLPEGVPPFIIAPLGRIYAGWCVRRMAADATNAFATAPQ